MPRKPDPDRPGSDCEGAANKIDMSEPTRADLVAEALSIFGQEAARELARLLRVPFEACQPELRS